MCFVYTDLRTMSVRCQQMLDVYFTSYDQSDRNLFAEVDIVVTVVVFANCWLFTLLILCFCLDPYSTFSVHSLIYVVLIVKISYA